MLTPSDPEKKFEHFKRFTALEQNDVIELFFITMKSFPNSGSFKTTINESHVLLRYYKIFEVKLLSRHASSTTLGSSNYSTGYNKPSSNTNKKQFSITNKAKIGRAHV